MRKKWAWILAAVLLLSVLSTGSLAAATNNYISNISGGRAGYSTAISTEADKIPVLVIRPDEETRLENLSFELRLTNAYWDFEAFRQTGTGIEAYGSVDGDGVFTPETSNAGYLTGGKNPPGVAYKMEIGNTNSVAVVTLDPYYILTSYDAIYIPILAEITGDAPHVEIYDPNGGGITVDGIYTFASAAVGGVTTQVRPGEVREFSQTALLSDVEIRELTNRAMVGSTLTLQLSPGYRWINIDQIQLAGRNTAGLGVGERTFATQGQNATENQGILRLALSMGDSGENRTFILKNLQIEALPDNTGYGPVSLTLSGCNMEQETVVTANRIRVDYRFTAESQSPAKLIAGNKPADALAESLRTLKAVLEETSPGRWRSGATMRFTLPEGITARAVRVNTFNLASDLQADTVIRRIDENAYALDTENSGLWTLAANGLTVQELTTKSGLSGKIELTFYLEADADFRGVVYLSAGGSALSHEITAAVAEVAESSVAGPVTLTIGSKEMKIGEETLVMDVAPYIEDGYTMVPVSFVAGALGLSAEGVKWDGAARTVTVTAGEKTAVLTIDSNQMSVNGVMTEIAKAPVIRDGRTFLPFRVLGEQVLGAAVGWDGQTGTAVFY